MLICTKTSPLGLQMNGGPSAPQMPPAEQALQLGPRAACIAMEIGMCRRRGRRLEVLESRSWRPPHGGSYGEG
ncbi:hypothetical protein SRHO_G00238920 [Serrasalmus rhombeus]